MDDNSVISPNFRTQVLVCRDCKADFVLTGQEQLFYFRRGLTNPVRCKECRQARRFQITNNQGGDLK
jgi:hypothetical protein